MTPMPERLRELMANHPEVWEAFVQLGGKCHEGGPLEEKTRRLVKLGLAIGMRHEGAVHSAVRGALASGVTPAEMKHVALLAITTIGWPGAMAAMTWIQDGLELDTESPEA